MTDLNTIYNVYIMRLRKNVFDGLLPKSRVVY